LSAELLCEGPEYPRVTIAGLVPTFSYDRWLPSRKDIKRSDRFIHLAFAAAHQAWTDSGLPSRLDDEQAERASSIIGVGFCGMARLLEEHRTLLLRGASRISAYSVPALVSNLAIRYNLQGPSLCVTSACASGAHSIGEAFMSIRSGRCDLALAGGAEATVTPLTLSGFAAAHALCVTRNEDPERASRPFERSRDGFVLGEGAGIMVLEELEHAKARNARIYAEIAGYGATCDAYHTTLPPTQGAGAARAMRQALRVARMAPDEVDYVNAHGTSTQANDRAETLALHAVFGAHARDELMVSSTKSMTGHLLGAAGGVESVISTLAISENVIPPTTNYDEPDPECDLDYVPNLARQTKVDVAMSNCFGFGGTNAVLLFRRLAA
jgi:3-oxoacyl-[acyl-carrier-protein] synthase II